MGIRNANKGESFWHRTDKQEILYTATPAAGEERKEKEHAVTVEPALDAAYVNRVGDIKASPGGDWTRPALSQRAWR